jgi:asparaginyl-tRNA synthetase
MVEPEAAFFDLEDDMRLAQGLIQHLLRDALEGSAEEMEFFDRWIQPGLLVQLRQVREAEFTHLTYTQAIEALNQAEVQGQQFQFAVHWGMDLQSEHEKYLTEVYIKGPVIVTDYPKDIKAFYMKQNPDGKTVRAMDVLVPRLGEIIGGSQREDDYDKLSQRMQQLGMNLETYQWYLDLRRYGGAPHAGFGLGFERFLQYLTGMGNIRDLIPFFRAPSQAPC